MKMYPLLFIILIFFSCGRENEHQLADDSLYFQLSEMENKELQRNYLELRNNIQNKREKLSVEDGKKMKEYFISTLTDSLFHFWYDTEWDFNGITQEPRKGNIACGYFVTTTLFHFGFDLERVKLAQQPASIIIRTLCKKDDIKTFTNGNLKGLKEYLKKSNDGLYIIGLDNHVGFIHKNDTSIVMIHADAVNGKVCRERVDDCSPIVNSAFHMVGNLSDNAELLKKWRKKEKIAMLE